MRAFAGVTALTLTVASGAAIRWLWANIPADAGHRFESLPALELTLTGIFAVSAVITLYLAHEGIRAGKKR